AGTVVDPPPLATVNVTFTPCTGLLLASLTITLGAVTTAAPTVRDWLLPAAIAICVAEPATPVAVNPTGLPPRPVAVAVMVLAPAVVPSIQAVSDAIPDAFVAMVAGPAGFS